MKSLESGAFVLSGEGNVNRNCVITLKDKWILTEASIPKYSAEPSDSNMQLVIRQYG